MEQILSAAHRSAEDGCSYEIYPPVSQDGGLSTALADILAYTLSLAGEYIWQREAFNLSVDSKRRCLSGETRVGDCIEDEWFIVWLLLQISIKYPGCAAQSVSAFPLRLTDWAQSTDIQGFRRGWPVPPHRSSRDAAQMGIP